MTPSHRSADFSPRRLKSALLSMLCLGIVSCAETKTNIVAYDHGKPIGQHTVTQVLYGKLTTESSLFGEATMGNLDIGFRHLANLIATLVAAYIAGDVAKAQEVTTQLATKGATATQIAQIQATAATQAAAIATGVGVRP